jgi:hypothetical protein
MVGDRRPSENYYKVKEKQWWELIQRVKAGDERAYVELFNEFRNILMKMAYEKGLCKHLVKKMLKQKWNVSFMTL